MYARAGRQSSGGLASLIGAQTSYDIHNRNKAIPMLNTLLAENQPYTKTRKKTGFMEKAAPYLKMAGSVGGSYGDMSKDAGNDAQKDFQDKAGSQFGSTGGSSGGPPMSSIQQDRKPAPTGGTSGGPPMSSVNTDAALKKKKGGGLGNLMGIMSMFGGSNSGGGASAGAMAGGK
jgi:hypothetical protein